MFPYMQTGGFPCKNLEKFLKISRTRGIRLKDVAKAGISTSQLSRFEKGQTDLTIQSLC